MKKIKTKDAVGHILCHDITQIIKDVTKDTLFKKGHVVRAEDIEKLLSVGKDNLYVWECDENHMHENEAAEILCQICENKDMKRSLIKEGKIELFAEIDGLLKIDVNRLKELNSVEEIAIATRHSNTAVKKGDKLAGMRVIPLIISKEKINNVKEKFKDKPLFELFPFHDFKVGIVITGNEVYYKRIEDTFGPVIEEKLKEYNLKSIGKVIVDDNQIKIQSAIEDFIKKGATMIICTGGMSVDPDDLTPSAIKAVGGEIISYGAPVLPGAMFLLSYKGEIPIMGLPGCVMYAKRTVFDLVFPRIIAKEKLSKQDLASLGHGGLCLNCNICTYPNCGFGKGY